MIEIEENELEEKKRDYWWYARFVYVIIIIIFVIILALRERGQTNNLVQKIMTWDDSSENYDTIVEQLQKIEDAEGVSRMMLKLTNVESQLQYLMSNSRWEKVRESSAKAFHNLERKEAVPVLQKAMNDEIKKCPSGNVIGCREYSIIDTIAHILAREKQYDKIFVALMKAHYYVIAFEKKDKNAFPYMRKALKNSNDFIKIEAAFRLAAMGETGNDIFDAAYDFINNDWARAKEEASYELLPESMNAIIVLQILKDERALPVLEEIEQEAKPPHSEAATLVVNKMKTMDVKIY